MSIRNVFFRTYNLDILQKKNPLSHKFLQLNIYSKSLFFPSQTLFLLRLFILILSGSLSQFCCKTSFLSQVHFSSKRGDTGKTSMMNTIMSIYSVGLSNPAARDHIILNITQEQFGTMGVLPTVSSGL